MHNFKFSHESHKSTIGVCYFGEFLWCFFNSFFLFLSPVYLGNMWLYLRDFSKYFESLLQLWSLDIWTQVADKYVKMFYKRQLGFDVQHSSFVKTLKYPRHWSMSNYSFNEYKTPHQNYIKMLQHLELS